MMEDFPPPVLSIVFDRDRNELKINDKIQTLIASEDIKGGPTHIRKISANARGHIQYVQSDGDVAVSVFERDEIMLAIYNPFNLNRCPQEA